MPKSNNRGLQLAIRLLCALSLAGLVAACIWHEPTRTLGQYLMTKLHGGYTVSERVAQFGERVQQALAADFQRLGLSYPAANVALVAFKDTQTLELYVRGQPQQPWQLLTTYPIMKASGQLGPKLREGDLQVPEGIYQSESLNPNSRYHLAIRVNYPNQFDQAIAAQEGRTNLGGDIMVHGSNASVGCLAMGNDVAERLFVLAALSQTPVAIIISPTDFRQKSLASWQQEAAPWLPANTGSAIPAWRTELYQQLELALKDYPPANSTL